jgi:hypothetical protein
VRNPFRIELTRPPESVCERLGVIMNLYALLRESLPLLVGGCNIIGS